MLKSEQRKKLEAEARDNYDCDCKIPCSEVLAYLAGAEALARIQSDHSRSDEEFISTECAFEVSRPALHHLGEPGMTAFDKGWDDKHEKGIRAGIARYRPLVEEMLQGLKQYDVGGSMEYGRRIDVIARAEKMLGKK